MTDKGKLRLMCAPMQGVTDVAFRHIHSGKYRSVEYYTPFIRVEKGIVRRRDIADWLSPLNEDTDVVPQVIFRDCNELKIVVDALLSAGSRRVDLNLGCPFPPQVKKGRGAGMIGRIDELSEVSDYLKSMAGDIEFSVKMRLGIERPDEWRGITHVLNDMPLSHVTVHPRTARQQYSGSLHLDEFASIMSMIDFPVIYNGDIMKPRDIDDIWLRFPEIVGVMVGRGLVYRPSLFDEWINGVEMSYEELCNNAIDQHRMLLEYYSNVLCGDSQVLSKVQSLVTYLEPYIDRKKYKQLFKTHNLQVYKDIFAQPLQR